MIVKYSEFDKVNEESTLDDPEVLGRSIIHASLSWGFINNEEAEDVNIQGIANEVAWEHKDDEEIGSSDMTFIVKSFLDGMGKKTDFVNGKLVVLTEESNNTDIITYKEFTK